MCLYKTDFISVWGIHMCFQRQYINTFPYIFKISILQILPNKYYKLSVIAFFQHFISAYYRIRQSAFFGGKRHISTKKNKNKTVVDQYVMKYTSCCIASVNIGRTSLSDRLDCSCWLSALGVQRELLKEWLQQRLKTTNTRMDWCWSMDVHHGTQATEWKTKDQDVQHLWWLT